METSRKLRAGARIGTAVAMLLAALAVVLPGTAAAEDPPAEDPAPATSDEMSPELADAVTNAIQDGRELPLDSAGNNGPYPVGELGWSVATAGTWAIVGVPTAIVSGGGASGAVYGFQRSGTDWKLRERFQAFSMAPGDRFGESVAMAGNYVLIGQPGSNDGGTDVGLVEAWQLSGTATWNRIGRFQGDLVPGGRFGSSVSLDGSVAAVGSPGSGAGAVDLFIRSGANWNRVDHEVPGDVDPSGAFGATVDVDGTYVAIGAPGDSSGEGAAFVYQRSGNTLVRKAELFPSTPQSGSGFGTKVALDGTTAVATQPGWTDGSRNGKVHVFSGATWPETTAITSDPGASFARAADIAGTTIVVAQNGNQVVPYVKATTGNVWNRGIAVSVAPDTVDLPSGALAIAGNYAVYGSPTTPGAGGEPNAGAMGVLFKTGSTWARQERILVPIPTVGEQFGYSVAFDGEYAIVGARSASGPGAAYLFRSNGAIQWHFQAKLTADTPTSGDGFGASVGIHGAYAVVGAPGEGDGAAYLFFRNGSEWSRQARVTGTGGPVQRFGDKVAINGTNAAITAPGGVGIPGAAFVFLRSGTAWAQQARVVAPGTVTGDGYGSAVAIEGTTLVVGAAQRNTQGEVFVFVKSGTAWPLKATLLPTSLGAPDQFGASVDISGTRVAVGAPTRDTATGVDSGAVFVFTKAFNGTWSAGVAVAPSSMGAASAFGADVAIDGTMLLVGDPLGPGASTTSGGRAFVYGFSSGSWPQTAVLTQGFSSQNGSECGRAVDLSKGFSIVGCPLFDTFIGADTGKAFINYP